MSRPATSLYLTQEEIEILLKIAAFCDFYQTRGAGKRLNQGNISALNREIAKLPSDKWGTLKRVIKNG